jgi:hypothetical protein
MTKERGARARRPLAPRLLLFGLISLFTLGLGALTLLDGIAMLGNALDGSAGSERNVVLVLGLLTAAAALVPLALWAIAGWAIFKRGDRWEW